MKHLKLSLLALTFGMMSVVAQTSKPAPMIKTVSTSPILWKSEMIELGDIPQGKPKPIEFTFKNTSKSDVIITNVKASCGCTATDYTKTPIKAGESAKVTATYNAANVGAFTKTLTVTTNAEDAPKILSFKGTVIQ